jgi:hypothetical protein
VPPDTSDWPKPPHDPPMQGLAGALIAFPNPSTGLFELAWDVWPGDRGRLRVCDLAGRVLLEQPIWRENRPSRLDLGDWRQGMYILEVTSGQGRVFRTRVELMR